MALHSGLVSLQQRRAVSHALRLSRSTLLSFLKLTLHLFQVHVVKVAEVAVITEEYFGERFLLAQGQVVIEAEQLLLDQVEAQIDLLLFNVVIYAGSMVHVMLRYHQLDVGEQVRDDALVPVVLV